jgi:uncharacterized repeat protein (TIGR02543 family)
MKATSKRILSIILTLCMALASLAVMPILATAANYQATVQQIDSVEAIRREIQEKIDEYAVAGDTITVTGAKTNVTASLALVIPADITVVWAATYKGTISAPALINLSGAGTFVVADDADVTVNEIAINAVGVDVTVTGGSVSGGVAIASDSNVTISGGAVTAAATGGVAISVAGTTAKLDITGGTVTGSRAAVVAQSVDVAVSGGTVSAADDDSIAIQAKGTAGVAVSGSAHISALFAGIEAQDGNVTVAGGSVTATEDIAILAIGSGEVTVSGAGSVVGAARAIVTSTGKVTVAGGNVETTDADGIAIVSEVGVSVTGGNITGGAGAIASLANVQISGGTVTTTEITDDSYTVVAAVKTTVTGGSISGRNALATETGAILVTGGTVSGSESAIYIKGSGVAFALASTVSGDQVVKEGEIGAIVLVDSAPDAIVLGELNGASDGLAVTGGAGVAAVWDCTGGTIDIVVTLGDEASTVSTPWGKLFTPILINGAVERGSDTVATISFHTNVNGKAYALALHQDAAVPSSATVQAGALLGEVAIGTVSGAEVALTTGAHNIYVVVEDAAGNLSSPLKITVAAYTEKYSVTVVGGTGNTSVTAGTIVRITAVAPEGKVFDAWTTDSSGVSLENANDASTAFIMPENDVTVTATFKDAPPPVKYIFSTKYEQTTRNWLRFFLCFGWIWMWFTPPV